MLQRPKVGYHKFFNPFWSSTYSWYYMACAAYSIVELPNYTWVYAVNYDRQTGKGIISRMTTRPRLSRKSLRWVVIMSVSNEYDRYLRDAIHYQQLLESSSLTDVSVRENIYTNIVGGLGFFGAATEQKVPWWRAYTDLSWIPASSAGDR